MNSLKMKVLEYQAQSGSLIVKFASDVAIKPIDEYPALAFQPHMFDTTDPELLLKRIAQAGVAQAKMQDKEDSIKADEALTTSFANLVGQEYIYQVAVLTAPEIAEGDNPTESIANA